MTSLKCNFERYLIIALVLLLFSTQNSQAYNIHFLLVSPVDSLSNLSPPHYSFLDSSVTCFRSFLMNNKKKSTVNESLIKNDFGNIIPFLKTSFLIYPFDVLTSPSLYSKHKVKLKQEDYSQTLIRNNIGGNTLPDRFCIIQIGIGNYFQLTKK